MNAPIVDRIVRPLATLAGILIVLGFAAAAALGAPPQAGTPEHEKFERDRRAILAMAGEYRVAFDFRETVPLRAGYELKSPYHADATEFVEVVEDSGDRIVLQHVLVLDGKGDDSEARTRVVKHWRQDWEYEAARLFEFRGHNTWAPRDLSADEVRGTWAQRVFQVDDSPRYQGFGKWAHAGDVSTWTSNPTWRPLPRREWTKRKDYHVLVGVNRHTVTPGGWYHEQDNTKVVLDDAGDPAGRDAALVREVGVNVYQRVSDVDFAAGRDYWARTGGYWSDVRAAWTDLFARGEPIRLQKQVDGKPMFRHLFNGAEDVQKAGGAATGAHRDAVDAVLAKFIVR